MTDNKFVVFAGILGRGRSWVSLQLLLVILLFCLPFDSDAKCLQNRSEVFPKRHFYYNSSSLPIRIESSDRSSHQLISRILRILLLEVLGYAKVELIDGLNSMDTSLILDRLSGREGVPEAMINLEVWLPSGFNIEPIMSKRNIINGGPLGPSGRFGWFLPTSMIDEVWNKSSIVMDHWKSLRLTEITSQFALPDDMDLLQNFLTRKSPDSRESFCDTIAEECHDGLYYPLNHHCNRLSGKCAILISSTPDLHGGKLLYQVDTLELNVAVAWIGDRFDSFVQKQTARNLPVLFFNWTPNDLTSSQNYSRMLFPTCQTTNTLSTNCDFDLNQLTKMMWAVIKSHIPEAYHVVTQMVFSEEELNLLLSQFFEQRERSDTGRDEVLEEVACQWVQSQNNTWEKWIPGTPGKPPSSKTTINLCGMFPLSGPYFRSHGILPGAAMALAYINSDPNILPDIDLQMQVLDTKCMADKAVSEFFKLVLDKTHKIAGIIGPYCSEAVEAVAGVAKHFNTVVISYSPEVQRVRDREQYPLFLSTVPHFLQYKDIYVEVFKKFNWKQVSLLAEDRGDFPDFHSNLKDHFLSNSIQVLYERKMPHYPTMHDAEKHIEELKRRDTRIIILTSLEPCARKVICAAFKKGMTARNGYVWFLPTWFTRRWWANYGTEIVPCSAEEMQEVILSHLIFVVSFLGPLESEIVGNMTVQEWFDSYSELMDTFSRWAPSDYASYAYDAVLVYALGLHELLSEDPTAIESLHTYQTVQKFMQILRNLSFSGASGTVKFSGADRTGTVLIIQYVGNDNYSQVGHFLLDKDNASDHLYLNESQLHWTTKDGLVPSDGQPEPKVCSIEGFRRLLNVECDAAIAVANIIGISLFVVVMIICLIVVKKRYDAKVKRIKDSIGLSQDMSWLGLDKWEIPRDQVVLNRKLGEGAFGTVYGGEAMIDSTWLAVAVKTLKIGSNAEDKLDFLSEAETMKRFDHDNIVKLLGVCTRREPAYAIMEFMLHGDLKTYLLSRRQLVSQSCKEAEDVNAQALTQMSLDVALGLKYLSNLKYVHRDLACRNCLVHAGKTVKIGDFGMTRPLYDSDYYRFNKRGMFPVRWMAPESLTDGIFSASSDVWSYGVLLYEIMTFGSFPYQGLSNRQVLNFVKSGNRISLPKGCPLKVQELIRSCWTLNAHQRIMIEDIVDILEQNPLLIIPCLDDPSRAIALEGTGSLEMNLLPRSRIRSAQKWSSEHPPMRGLSLSSPEKGNSSEDESPDHIVSDPFNLLTPLPSADGAVVGEQNSVSQRHSTGHPVTVYSRRPFDMFMRSSRLSRSISTDERVSVDNEMAGGRYTSNLLMHDAKPRASVRGSLGREDVCDISANRNSLPQTLPPSLESRTDSDYCSQQSKEFPTMGCLLP